MIAKKSTLTHSPIFPFILGAALLAAQGCKEDDCQTADPSFEVMVKWEAALPLTTIDALWSRIVAASVEKEVVMESMPLKTKGWTSFVVLVGPKGADGFRGEVNLEARDASGAVLARGSLVFDGTGDACNFLTIPLQQYPCTPSCAEKTCGADDGCQGKCQTGSCTVGQTCIAGVCHCDKTSCPDGCCQGDGCFPGTSDDHCGTGTCVDCLQTQQACNAERTCISCTPQCDGKSCGAANGCGGTCSNGSCSTGQVCVGGICICNGSSCPKGCCSTTKECVSGITDALCGKGGENCTSCATPAQICKDQACQTCTPQCNGSCDIANGCGGTCSCPSDKECDNQICVLIACRHCADADDCQTQCQLWGSTGGVCKTPGSTDPKDCCDCFPLSTGTNTIGFLEADIVNGRVRGWACDPDDPWESIMVHIAVGGPSGDPLATLYPTIANLDSEVAVSNACQGGNYHRFSFQIPDWQNKSGQPVYGYGISIHGGWNSMLSASPQTIP